VPLVCGILAVVPHTRALTAAAIVLVTAALAGCGSSAPGQAAARHACKTYAKTGRYQVADIDVRAKVQSDAQRAASADARWQTLLNDIRDAYTGVHLLPSATNDDYVAVDRRVEADCKAAGEDIGDLPP
jgi:hypothetical protein